MHQHKKRIIQVISVILLVILPSLAQFNEIYHQNLNLDEIELVSPKVSGLDPQIKLPTLSNSSDMDVGDFNNDGYNDIVVVNYLTAEVLAFIWNPITKNWDTPFVESYGFEPQSIHIGDANNDGYDDIVVTDWLVGNVIISHGRSNDYPEYREEIPVGGEVYNAFIGDVNDDDYNDVVAVMEDGISIILWNDSLSDWDSPIFVNLADFYSDSEWESSFDIFIADVNNNGVNEIYVNGYPPATSMREVVKIEWDGLDWEIWPVFTVYSWSIHVGDADNDGLNEVVTANYGDTASIYYAPSGTVTKPVGLLPDDHIEHTMHLVSVGDVNNDGYNDVVTANNREHTVSILLWNESAGDWNSQVKKPVGLNPVCIVAADVNNDGYTDIITANEGDSTVSVILWNEPPAIIINQPYETELFGKQAPYFNISIIDPDPDTMWYTLDGGIHNHTFTSNGTINQTLWDYMGNGTVTIDFYVNDTGSNVGHNQVTVRKDINNPVITILKPSSSQQYIQAPFFNLSVDQPDIDSVWYTIDDGIHNYSIVGFEGLVDEIRWNAASYGNINLEFYMNDSLNNIGYKQVYIEKVQLDNDTLSIEIIHQVFIEDSFNITFFVRNEEGIGIDIDVFQIWWNSSDVSSNVIDQGGGVYSISLTAILVREGEEGILLNMSVQAEDYEDLYFETYLAMVEKEEQEPKKIGFRYSIWIMLGILFISVLLITLKHRNK